VHGKVDVILLENPLLAYNIGLGKEKICLHASSKLLISLVLSSIDRLVLETWPQLFNNTGYLS